MADFAELTTKIEKHKFSVFVLVGMAAFLSAELLSACPRLESELIVCLVVLAFWSGRSSAGKPAKRATERAPNLHAASVLKRPSGGAHSPRCHQLASGASAPQGELQLTNLSEDSIMRTLASLKRTGRFDLAPSVLREALRQGVHLGTPAYSIVMGTCNKSNRPRETLEVFWSMQEENVVLDAVSYSDAICACGLLKDIQGVSRLFAEMQSAGIEPGAHCYAVLIEAHRRCGLHEMCWQIYRSLQERGLVCDGKLFKVTIESVGECCLREHGLEILQAMQALGFQPAHGLQNLVICAWKSKLPQHLVEGFHALNDSGMSLSATAYRCLMAAHERSDPGRTIELYCQAAEEGVRLDRVAVNAMLCAYPQLGMTEKALELLEQMPKHGLVPNGKTYGTVIRSCAASNRLTDAIGLFDRMLEDGVEPNRFTYHNAISCCLKAKRLKKAIELYRGMLQAGVSPCNNTFRHLSAVCHKRAPALAARIDADFARAKELEAASEWASDASTAPTELAAQIDADFTRAKELEAAIGRTSDASTELCEELAEEDVLD